MDYISLIVCLSNSVPLLPVNRSSITRPTEGQLMLYIGTTTNQYLDMQNRYTERRDITIYLSSQHTYNWVCQSIQVQYWNQKSKAMPLMNIQYIWLSDIYAHFWGSGDILRTSHVTRALRTAAELNICNKSFLSLLRVILFLSTNFVQIRNRAEVFHQFLKFCSMSLNPIKPNANDGKRGTFCFTMVSLCGC